MNREFFEGKKVLVMGLGRFGGGVDVARFAAGCGAKVIVTDKAPPEKLSGSIEQLKQFGDIDLHLGSHDRADFENADVVVANPAVAPDSELLEAARAAGGLVTSQIAIFFELCPASIIGITGANGKSTTTALTAHVLRHTTSDIRHPTYENVFLSGNIGNRPLLADIDEITPRDLVVLELSSFQLEQLAQIEKAPKVALLTNLTPNHLDRHGTFAAYCAAKENIFKFQKLDEGSPAVSIFNAEDEVGAEWFGKYLSEPGRTCIKFSPEGVPAQMRKSYPLPGRANLANLAAALAVARCFDVPDDAIERALPDFKSLPHRLELVAELKGVRWYNDSIATTPQSAVVALEAFESPSIIIAGGYDKNIPFDELGRKIAQTAKAAILLGQTAPKIAQAVQNAQMSLGGAKSAGSGRTIKPRGAKVEIVASLADAVALAAKLAVPGDVVLLSPACASYDMFDNFQQRGQQFAELVAALPTS
ncbi:MAG: UDP-N-acetylmuramoyl-L-alanine--D-glutamate ligase [Sedimentisphaerales bacterium]|nr:UDP-N-acetylmuramoyl-L-alanine--D-glutamate ligase [Sedimentisphaerales bacterium]